MSDVNTSLMDRRQFLGKTSTIAAGIAVAPGVMLYSIAEAKPLDQAVSTQNRWGMLIDTNKCAKGCDSCVSACQSEHGWGGANSNEVNSNQKQSAQWIRKVELRHKGNGAVKSLPMMCQHCEHPPCVDVCPTGASFKRVDGIVLVDKHICIGCRYCMMACPYKARSFIHEALTDQKEVAPRGKGTVESCTLCVHKIDAGEGTTACANACAEAGHKAILVGDLKNPHSDISKALARHASTQLRADLGLNPGVSYTGI
jgi:tetrathionate reductase subunit B